MTRWIGSLGASALLAIAMGAGAHADENLLGYSYGAEILPKGENEAYVWITDRRGKGQGEYDAQDYSLEVEHGFTDRLQASVYLDFVSHHIKGAAPVKNGVPEYPDVSRGFAFQGIKASAKYNILSPYRDPIGLAVYFEPGFKRFHKVKGERETQLFLETKLILQKNFMDDRLVWIGNVTYEQEFEHEEDDEWEAEAELELTTGFSYRFAPNWSAGVEARYHSEYPNFPEQVSREHYAIFLGPTLHYGAKKWWATLTWLPQIHGEPQEPARSTRLHLDEHERSELRFKLGYFF